jgi:hypothetical protein
MTLKAERTIVSADGTQGIGAVRSQHPHRRIVAPVSANIMMRVRSFRSVTGRSACHVHDDTIGKLYRVGTRFNDGCALEITRDLDDFPAKRLP